MQRACLSIPTAGSIGPLERADGWRPHFLVRQLFRRQNIFGIRVAGGADDESGHAEASKAEQPFAYLALCAGTS